VEVVPFPPLPSQRTGRVQPGKCRNPEKVRYYVRREAESAAVLAGRTLGHTMRVYPCGMHFHLTSQPANPRAYQVRLGCLDLGEEQSETG
jgi:hypothetical protein